MLLIFFGCLIVAFALMITLKGSDFSNIKRGILFVCGILLGGIGLTIILCGCYTPLNGYFEPVINEEVNLMPIYVDDETGEEIYAIKASNGDYFVKYMDNDELILKAIECNIIEDENIEYPVKRISEYDAKPSIWSLGLDNMIETELVIPSRNICD